MLHDEMADSAAGPKRRSDRTSEKWLAKGDAMTKSYINDMYRNIPGLGFKSPVEERAELLRAVSKTLIRSTIPLERRRAIIKALQNDFGVELTESCLEHFMEGSDQ